MGRTPRRPAEPKAVRWDIYLATAKARWLGTVTAPDAEAAIVEGAHALGRDPRSLFAIKHKVISS